jgi:hypothetical protein
VLPAGAAFSAGYTYRRLTRLGASPGLATWVLVASGILSTAALAFLGLAGAQVRGVGLLCSALGRLTGVLIAAAAIGAVALLAWATRRRSRLERIGALVVRAAGLARPLFRRGRPRGTGQRVLFLGAEREPVAVDPVGWLGAGALAAANWVADGAALALAFRALGLDVPWQGLLLAYVASQIAFSLPLLGCVGLAEGSLTIALVCIGVRPADALAVALVYRLVSFWATLPMGWLAFAHLRRLENRTAPAGGGTGGRSEL